jgi:rod shape-determining protein MreC
VPHWRTTGKNPLIFLACIVLASLLLITVSIRYGKENLFFESVIIRIFSPAQSLITQARASISGLLDRYFFLTEVSQENNRLLKEVDQLTRRNSYLLETFKQQERIKQLQRASKTSKNGKVKSLMALVIGRDPTQWSKMIFIDKGTDDGIRGNVAVVTDAGIVGHIIHSTATTSKVLLITDSRSAVDSLFQKTRVPGVSTGTGEGLCKIKFVPIDAELEVGDKVISSGLGGVFPKGWAVGTVVKTVKRKQELFQDVVVAPSVDLSRLEDVLVLLPVTTGKL